MRKYTGFRVANIAAGVLAIAALSGFSSTAQADGSSFSLYNLGTKNCLLMGSWAATPGLAVEQYTCRQTHNQFFYADVISYTDPGGGAIVTLRNNATGLCLDLAQKSMAPGINIIQNTCDGSTSQQWTLDAPYAYQQVSPGVVVNTTVVWRHVKNVYSGLCIDSVMPGSDAGRIQQYTCANVDNQLWRLPVW